MLRSIVARGHQLLQRAVQKGEVVPESACETCGRIGKVGAHHWRGYEGDAAVDVWWICSSCNAKLRGCHDGRFALEQAREFIRSGKKPEDKICKGFTVSGDRCQNIVVFNQDYCNTHNPNTFECKAITRKGARCRNPAQTEDGFCSNHWQR